MTTRDLRAFRASLGSRIVNRAGELGIDPNRVRRQLIFHRILARLALTDQWVLKGGFALEVRLGTHARATRDLDVATLGPMPQAEVQETLAEALALDVDGDGFGFAVTPARSIGPDGEAAQAWSVTITASLGGEEFGRVHVDIAARAEELVGGVTSLLVAAPVPGVGLSDVHVRAVYIAQHAAEKIHALCRRYAGDRPSSRVKDLVDLTLLLEAGLLPDPRLGDRLHAVYRVRDGSGPPTQLPELPPDWRRTYAGMAEELDLTLVDADAAMSAVAILLQDSQDIQADPEAPR